MKKIACMFITMVLIVANCSAVAEGRNVLEFIDLLSHYMSSLTELGIKDADFDKTGYAYRYSSNEGFQDLYDSLKAIVPLYTDEDEYWLTIPAGELIVSVPSFEIVRAQVDVMDLSNSATERSTSLLRAAAVYAALEYGYLEDAMTSALYKRGAMDMAADEFIEAFEKSMSRAAISGIGAPVLMLSKNYDYYLSYMEFDYETNAGIKKAKLYTLNIEKK